LRHGVFSPDGNAGVSRDADIPLKATRVSDFVAFLTALQFKTGVIVLDAARPNPFSLSGAPLANGLALYEPGRRLLLAYNSAPGTIAPVEKTPQGVYARTLAEMIRQGGSSVKDVFDKVRLRVGEITKGAQTPWNSAKTETSFVFVQPQTPALASKQAAAVHATPDRDVATRRAPRAGANERLVDGALGAMAGAVVGGPIGLVAGGVIGAAAGPAVTSSWRQNAARHTNGHRRRHANLPAKSRSGG